MNFPCSAALLLLLLGAVGAKGGSSPAKEKIYEWNDLRVKTEEKGMAHAEANCSAGPEETRAFFLFVDLFYFHPNSILPWAWPRYDFYSSEFTKLAAATDKTFCSYDPFLEIPKLVCHNNKCAKCEGLEDAADDLLKEACAYNGTGGEGAEKKEKEGGSIGEPEVWTPSDEACAPGWLTHGSPEQFYDNTANGKFAPREAQPCDYFPKVAVAYAYTNKLKSHKDRKYELEWKREFWEDKLRILKDGKAKNLKLCHPDTMSVQIDGRKFKKGPFVCGKDALCIDCAKVTKEMAEIFEACELQESTQDHQVSEECGAIRQKKNSTSSPEPQMTTPTSFAPTQRQLASTVFAATLFAHSLTRLL